MNQLKSFSMVELVFVIVILGILAAVAIPRFSLTRTDASVIAVEQDINNAISALQREVFAQNVNQSSINGEYILNTAGLSKSRWIADSNGVKVAKNGVVDSQNDCVIFNFENGNLIYEIKKIEGSVLCDKLLSRNTKRVIPLISSQVIF